MKKAISIFIIIIILLSAVSTAFAATSVSVSSSTANPGDTITISGVTDAAEFIAIRITDGWGNIVYFGGARVDISGNYSTLYTVPTDSTAGALNVTAGSGSDVASATITVVIPEPTPQRAVNPKTGMNDAGTPYYIWLIRFAAVIFAVMLVLYMLKSKILFSRN